MDKTPLHGGTIVYSVISVARYLDFFQSFTLPNNVTVRNLASFYYFCQGGLVHVGFVFVSVSFI